MQGQGWLGSLDLRPLLTSSESARPNLRPNSEAGRPSLRPNFTSGSDLGAQTASQTSPTGEGLASVLHEALGDSPGEWPNQHVAGHLDRRLPQVQAATPKNHGPA